MLKIDLKNAKKWTQKRTFRRRQRRVLIKRQEVTDRDLLFVPRTFHVTLEERVAQPQANRLPVGFQPLRVLAVAELRERALRTTETVSRLLENIRVQNLERFSCLSERSANAVAPPSILAFRVSPSPDPAGCVPPGNDPPSHAYNPPSAAPPVVQQYERLGLRSPVLQS